MKRFHSSLQSIHDVHQQQCRLAELEVARETAALVAAEQRYDRTVEEHAAARLSITRSFERNVPGSVLHGLQQYASVVEERVYQAREQVDLARSSLMQAQTRFREINSKVERLTRLIDRQRAAHRHLLLREQQQLLDETAVSRWPGKEEGRSSHHPEPQVSNQPPVGFLADSIVGHDQRGES